MLNARDLGGLRSDDGPETRRGAVVRSDGLLVALTVDPRGVRPSRPARHGVPGDIG